MDLENKFNIGKINNTYQRVDELHNANIFLGYNDIGKMSLVITEPGNVEKVFSSKIIHVDMNKRQDGKVALSFDLEENSFESLFLVFCEDIIESLREKQKNRILSYAVARWKYWKEMFKQSSKDMLTMPEIKGLIGELYVLQYFMIPKYGESNAIKSWMGPELSHKDFEINDTWYEIKSVSESSNSILISSVEQLDSELDGQLYIIRLEKTNALVKKSLTLNKIVSKITTILNDIDDLNLFRKKLDLAGYEYRKEYDDIAFIYKGMEIYSVNSSFPRITREMIPLEVNNVSYSLLLQKLQEFLV